VPFVTEIVIVGEAWGENEHRIREAFVGSSGIELLRMLDEGGVLELTSEDQNYIYKFWQDRDPRYIDMVWRMHPEIYRTNVFNLRPHGNKIENLCGTRQEGISGLPSFGKSKYFRAEFAGEIDRLAAELLEQDPNLIIACGNTPCWALLGNTKISTIRGTTHLSTHTVTGFKVLPVYHPAAVMRTWEYRPTTVADFIKAAREAKFPELRRPKREIWIDPSLDDIRRFKREHIDNCKLLSVDIETAGRAITCIGFAPRPDIAIVIPFVKTTRFGRNYFTNPASEREAWNIITNILADPATKKTFQNGMYDIAFLWRAYGIKVIGAEHDTMLLHHALYPESEKSLGFLGSIYTDEGSWKRMRKSETIKED
jgi:uracil-DNA glycosylase